MTPQIFSTPVTELFGIRHPLVCGGMMWLANADYVGAVVNAGAMGFITPRSFPTAEDFRAELRRCREITEGKPFGVNLYVSARPESNAGLSTFLDIAIEEGVRFVETAGYSPREFLPRIRDAGMRVIHKCTTLRHALSAERAGVDAVAILGAEAGGHPGMGMVGTMVQGAVVPPQLSIPVVLAGGMGTGGQLMAALALGAGGMLLATRMVVAAEIWAHDDYKRHIAEAGAADTRIILSIFGDNMRVLDNPDARKVAALEREGVDDFESYRALVDGRRQRRAYETGDWRTGTASVGQACGLAERIEPVEAIIDSIMEEAAAAQQRIAALGQAPSAA